MCAVPAAATVAAVTNSPERVGGPIRARADSSVAVLLGVFAALVVLLVVVEALSSW